MRDNKRLGPETVPQSLVGALALIRVIHKMASFIDTHGNSELG
jgi:hypothetical protein